ncbi:MAG: class II fructose-bisphosphate aldolase, partial [Sedimenticola sp.]|nr:class II fructose-bisphosphate aldolase [Sedimenticola sp.]
RLRHINEALKMPLVLHGSSGLSDDQLHRLIANGIAKVNAFTSITDRAVGLLRRNARAKDEGYIKLFSGVREEMEEEATRLMRTWGSAGRAAEVMEQCRPWHKVDYILKFNLPDADPEEMAMIVRRGREMLLPIPGVRNIEVSETVKNGTTPQYCWQMHLTSEEVVESLKQHSDFIKFNRRYINNRATDLTTVIYKTDQVTDIKNQSLVSMAS